MVDFCMRYGNPSTEIEGARDGRGRLRKDLFFPLYPHYAGATSATANDQFFRALMKEKRQPAVADRAGIFRASALYRRAGPVGRTRLCRAGPQARCAGRQLPRHADPLSDRGRPLPLPVPEDLAPVARTAGLGQRRSTPPSSRSSAPKNGCGPIRWNMWPNWPRQGKKRIAVIAPAFSADCIETLEEINGEIREASNMRAARSSPTSPA
jgi:ferrochelatase